MQSTAVPRPPRPRTGRPVLLALPIALLIGCSPASARSAPQGGEIVAADSAGCAHTATAAAMRERGGRPGTANEQLLFDLAVREGIARCEHGRRAAAVEPRSER
jgi:hypothetical protein